MAQHDRRLRAWQTARAMVLFTGSASLLVTAVWSVRGIVTLWQWLASCGVSLLAGVIVFAWRGAPSVVCGIASLVSALAALAAGDVSNAQLAAAGVHFEPYSAYKFGLLAFAVIAPSPIWCGVTIFAFGAAAPIIGYYARAPEFRAAMGMQEPWLTVLYALFGLILLGHRERVRVLKRRLDASQRIERLARVGIAIRDLSNSPLQTLTATTALLESGRVSVEEVIRINRNALRRLAELNELLQAQERHVKWSQLSGSFDAMAILREEMAHTEPQRSGAAVRPD